MCLIYEVGMVLVLIVVEFVEEDMWCLLFININVWLVFILCRLRIFRLVVLINWFELFNENVFVSEGSLLSILLMFIVFELRSDLLEMVVIGDGVIVFWWEIWELVIWIFLMLVFLFVEFCVRMLFEVNVIFLVNVNWIVVVIFFMDCF